MNNCGWESGWAEREALGNEASKLYYKLQPWTGGGEPPSEVIEEELERVMGKKIHTKKVQVADFQLESFGPFKTGSLWLMREETQMLREGIWFFPHRPTYNAPRPDEVLVPQDGILLFQGMGNKVMQDGRQRFYLFFLWEEKTIYMYWTYDQVTNVSGMNSELYRFFHSRLRTINGERV